MSCLFTNNFLLSFLNSENIAELVPELLVDNLERFLAVSTEDADALRSKLLQLEAELNASKQVSDVIIVLLALKLLVCRVFFFLAFVYSLHVLCVAA